MLGKLLTPFTTATAAGTIFRDVFIMAGTIIALLGALGLLTQEQVDALNSAVKTISDQWPTLVTLLGVLMTAGMSAYRALYKSTTNEGAAVAKAVGKAIADDKLPANTPVQAVELKTPAGLDNVTVAVPPVK